MDRQAVLEAVNPTRVLSHIAADGAGNLRGGVGGVVEAMGRSRLTDGQISHARLNAGEPGQWVDGQNLIEAGQREHQASPVWRGTARKASACTSGHHRDIVSLADPQGRSRLGFIERQGHGHRNLPVARQAITLVGPKRLLVGDQPIGRYGLGQVGQKPMPLVVRHGLADVGKPKFAELQFSGRVHNR